jgi:catechol 2,3-dioxygenase-like lactoylglutathione lyase family enzyme
MPGQQPRITGILESSLYVADLDRARAFYERLFGFRVFFADHRMCAMEVPGAHVLLLFLEGATDEPAPAADGLIPPHHGSGTLHLCFAIPADALEEWERRLERERIAVESRLHWPRGATSLYFRDPDGHSLEVATPGLWPNY